MAWKWFVQNNDLVQGPLSTEEVQSRFQNGQLPPSSLIWGPGLSQWQSLLSWKGELPQILENQKPEYLPEAWHYALGGQSYGPMPRETLVSELKDLPTVGEVMIWTKGMKEWAPLFEFHDLLNDVGVNKRQFPRGELTGKAILKTASSTLIAPLLSISEGGFGISLDSGLVSGELMSVELQSPQFRQNLHGKAEVRYISQGTVGLKFTQLSVETKGAIIQFIKQNQVRFSIKAA